ncbi:MAG TPA: pitrilysin family protein [Terriglobia bacterium]|nr:pitrilysin family protein [Terriglobia bacterium]
MKLRWCLVVFAAGALAFGQQKEQPPQGGPPKPFHLPETQDFILPNGMKVTLVPYGIIPRVAIRAYVSAGGINEAADQVWLSRLTGLLMKEGTKTRSAEQMADEAADAGGQLEIEPDVEFTRVGGVALSDHAAQFIALVADVLRNPSMPASEAPRLKADLARELAVARTQPGDLARERFLQTMFPNSPYGRVFPSESDLQGYSAADAQAFYRDNFSAARTHLYVAGKLDPGVQEAIRRNFDDWSEGVQPISPSANPVKAHSFALIDRPGAPQSTLYMGLPVADPASPDYIPLDVMNSLLGGSFASRITSNIREQKGYTYSPSSQIGTRTHVAYWLETADVTTSVTGPSMKEILYEIDRLRKEEPSEQELKGIQNYLAGLFVLRNTISPDAVIGQLHFVDSRGLNRSFLSEYVQKVAAVRPPEIKSMAERYIVPDQMAIVVVGDKSKIADQVKPYETATP